MSYNRRPLTPGELSFRFTCSSQGVGYGCHLVTSGSVLETGVNECVATRFRSYFGLTGVGKRSSDTKAALLLTTKR